MESKCKTLRVILLALVLLSSLSKTEVAAIAIAEIDNEYTADTLNDKTLTLEVTDYDWEHLWKVGTVRETTKQAVDDSEVLGWLPAVANTDIAPLKIRQRHPNSNSWQLAVRLLRAFGKVGFTGRLN